MTGPTVVIAFDGTHNAQRAIRYAASFLRAERAVVLTVWLPQHAGLDAVSIDLDGPPDPVEADYDMALADATRTNTEGVALARGLGLPAEPLCLAATRTVWSTIIDAAESLDADLVVTGTRGTTGLRSLMQTSVADHVLRRGRRPVLIVPPAT